MIRIVAGIVGILLIILLYMSGTFSDKKSGGDIAPENAIEQIQQRPGVVIDVRTPEEFAQGRLARTDQLIDFMADDFEDQAGELDRSQTYYLYCRSGNRSGQAMKWMQEHGFEEVYNIGGYQDLVDAGFESER
ncbi:MAG: rhodanese-like domain-containing protein [Bacteroidota bacterium]